MLQTYVKVYDERTGNPLIDNRSRKLNKMVNRTARPVLKVNTPRGRRRKKEITTAEYRNYVYVLVSVVEANQPHMKDVAPKTERYLMDTKDDDE